MVCPKPNCDGETVHREDEDSYYYQCKKCGYTFGHFIKPAQGASS